MLRYHVDLAAGTLSDRSVLVDGVSADNLELDVDGHLWIALPLRNEVLVVNTATGARHSAFRSLTTAQQAVADEFSRRGQAGVSRMELFTPAVWAPLPGPITGIILGPQGRPVYFTGLGNALLSSHAENGLRRNLQSAIGNLQSAICNKIPPMSRLSRRTFLSSTAAGVAAATALRPSSASARIQGANSRVRVAVIGTGRQGLSDMRGHMALDDVEIAAVCDVYGPTSPVRPLAPKAAQVKDFRACSTARTSTR